MAGVYDALVAYADSAPWPAERHDDERYLALPVTGRNGAWIQVAQAYDDRGQLVVYGLSPVDAPSDRRTEMALLLTRLNSGMILGNFELDLESGEVRFKASLDAEHAELTAELITPLLAATAAMMDRYLPAIQAVAGGGSSEEAIAAAGH